MRRHTIPVQEFDPDDPDQTHHNIRFVSTYSLLGAHPEFERRYRSVGELLADFCLRTSSHGIPHIAESYTVGGKLFWCVVFLACSIIFGTQTYYTVSRFLKYSTIVEMELEQFEEAINKQRTTGVAIAYGSKNQADINSTNDVDAKPDEFLKRKKRRLKFKPVYATCTCPEPARCMPSQNGTGRTPCMCFGDEYSEEIWPCYPIQVWTENMCSNCAISQSCSYPDRKDTSGSIPCLCQDITRLCMEKPEGAIKWWDPSKYVTHLVSRTTPPTMTTPSPEVVEALGMDTVKDTGSITAKAKENVVLIAASLDRETRVNLSYNLDEFVFSCTFNMGDCNLFRDFKLQVDPVYGNCYTFNHNDSVTLTNSRAGPMYGLRLLLNVNQTDYLSITEAAGIRLIIHEQDDEPFPDTFGYSAPVGVISSFGLKTGCFRNCFQYKIVRHCNCSDPRFPTPAGWTPCKARDPIDRNCLSKITNEIGGYYSVVRKDCKCVQPCKEAVFETAYSASAWPAMNYKTGECPPEVVLNDTEACREYFRLNTAFIEVYYEQLNFESLTETQAYSIVNLLSDFGGNIGLWIGFSVITCIEYIELILEMCFFCYYKKQRESKLAKVGNQYEMHYMNRVVDSPSVKTNRVAESPSPTKVPKFYGHGLGSNTLDSSEMPSSP